MIINHHKSTYCFFLIIAFDFYKCFWSMYCEFFFFWAYSCSAQDLLMALCSGITPGMAWGTIWDVGNQFQVMMCKASALSTIISFQPWYKFVLFLLRGHIWIEEEKLGTLVWIEVHSGSGIVIGTLHAWKTALVINL